MYLGVAAKPKERLDVIVMRSAESDTMATQNG
jgi:hypothetical protein